VVPKIKATCTQCHDTGRISEQHLTRQEWSGELKKMEGLGAEIPDADRSAILDYLIKNFGPASGATKPPAKKSQSAADPTSEVAITAALPVPNSNYHQHGSGTAALQVIV
jgi:hypothetical protein